MSESKSESDLEKGAVANSTNPEGNVKEPSIAPPVTEEVPEEAPTTKTVTFKDSLVEIEGEGDASATVSTTEKTEEKVEKVKAEGEEASETQTQTEGTDVESQAKEEEDAELGEVYWWVDEINPSLIAAGYGEPFEYEEVVRFRYVLIGLLCIVYAILLGIVKFFHHIRDKYDLHAELRGVTQEQDDD